MTEAVFEKTLRITRAELPEGLLKDLRMLNGVPPYHGMSNICYGDGYFSASIQRKYRPEMIEAAMALVIKPELERFRAATDAIASSTPPTQDWENAYKQLRQAIVEYRAAQAAPGGPGTGFSTRAPTSAWSRRMASASYVLGEVMAALPAVEGEAPAAAPSQEGA